MRRVVHNPLSTTDVGHRTVRGGRQTGPMSEQRPTSGGTVSSRFAALVAESERVHAELASLLGDGALAALQGRFDGA